MTGWVGVTPGIRDRIPHAFPRRSRRTRPANFVSSIPAGSANGRLMNESRLGIAVRSEADSALTPWTAPSTNCGTTEADDAANQADADGSARRRRGSATFTPTRFSIRRRLARCAGRDTLNTDEVDRLHDSMIARPSFGGRRPRDDDPLVRRFRRPGTGGFQDATAAFTAGPVGIAPIADR